MLETASQMPSASAKLVRYFSNAGLGASFLLRLSHRGSAQADAANSFLADFDRNPAAERTQGENSKTEVCRPVTMNSPSIGCTLALR